MPIYLLLYNTVEGRGTRDTARCVARMRILSGNVPCGRLADTAFRIGAWQTRGLSTWMHLGSRSLRPGPLALLGIGRCHA